MPPTVAHLDALGRIVMQYDTTMAGPEKDQKDATPNRIHQTSMEAGERWMLNDVSGKPIRGWDSRGYRRRLTYDALRRPTDLYVTENNAERLAERTVYGENQGDANNHRTRVYQVYDGAGIVTSVAYDFKGKLLEGRRDLLPGYKQAVNWLLNPAANDGSYTSRTSYDALNRPLSVTSPDNSIYRPSYNEANLLDQVNVNLRGAATATPFVTNIDYNAKGQRQRIVYGNGAETAYEHDPLTFRLSHLKTTRPSNPDTTASNLYQNASVVQDLRYTYDPIGNLSRIEDSALKTVFYNGQQIDPVGQYTYDALYRLIAARGREHIGQNALSLNPPNGNYRDYPYSGNSANPSDLQALRNYVENYDYDPVGNFEALRHLAAGGNWSRNYDYAETSLIEPNKNSNRLTRTTLGNGTSQIQPYSHDAHGNMTSMPHLAAMLWDFEDQLQQVNLGGGGTAYYVYDAGGQRVRKVIENLNGTRQKERIYLGGFEIYREYSGNGAISLARESLHVMDDKQRIALAETRTVGNDGLPAQVIRYQLGNHLGSASVELDNSGALISYEEYHPYGTTAFQAGRSAAEVSLKRYRYTGKERDEETGFSYHGTRYYAAWLGRWTACDPAGITPGVNLYRYAANRPINLLDPDGMQECTASPYVCDPKFYKAPKTAAFTYGELSPLGKSGVTTTTHDDIKSDASKYSPSSMSFGFTDVAKWKTDPEYLMKFKGQFVYENREIIKAAAVKYDLPAELVAGVVFNEIGGKDPIKPAVYWARSWIPGTSDKDETSLGQQSIQVRRAAESLGYNPKNLSDPQRNEILSSIKDPSQSIFIAAKHLSDLRNVDSPGKSGKDLTSDDIKLIGARYNQGPNKPIDSVKKDLSYGQTIIKRWYQFGNLLTTAPAKLEYSPVENNVVKPINSWFGQLEWEIKKLYGVPY
jgi:RHS repeat-associated protein